MKPSVECEDWLKKNGGIGAGFRIIVNIIKSLGIFYPTTIFIPYSVAGRDNCLSGNLKIETEEVA